MWQLIRKMGAGLLLVVAMQVVLMKVVFAQEDVRQRVVLINQEVEKLYRAGKYPQALEKAQQVLAIAEKELGLEHPETGAILNNLAELHRAMGEYQKALPSYIRAIAIAEKAQGLEHPATSTRLSNLALLYLAMGEYQKALALHTRALAIAEKAQGPEHPDTGTRLNNLALLYEEMGEYQKALPLHSRALAIAEKVHGPEHPDTGRDLNNLAGVYESMGEHQKALPLYLRALAIGEKAQGPEHPDTGTKVNNLAFLYKSMGDYQKALSLYARALAIAEKVQGPEHPATGSRLNNLAVVYEYMGEYQKALRLYVRALAISMKTQGPEHTDTGISLNNLARTYKTMGDYQKALPLFERALTIAEKAQGPEHPRTGMRLNNLAELHFALAEYEKAFPLYMRSFAIAVSRAGANPELLANVALNLCKLTQTSNRSAAIFYCKLAVNTRQTQRNNAKTMDKDLQRALHAITQEPYLLLNRLLTESQRYYEAEEVLLAMKSFELNRITRADAVQAKAISRTASEVALESEINDLGARMARLVAEKEQLKSAAPDEKAFAKVQEKINLANLDIQKKLAEIPSRLKDVASETNKARSGEDTKLQQLFNRLARELPQEGNVMLIINAEENITTVQLITPYRERRVLQLAIGTQQLDGEISAMRNAILTTSEAYKQPAQKIYELLFAPIEKAFPELNQDQKGDQQNKPTKPQTIALFLDGRLRTLPIAALIDAKGKFFAEKYRFALYNIIAHDKAADLPQSWQVAAWGNPNAVEAENLLPLKNVAQELNAIVRDPAKKGSQGLLPGKRYFGKDFTRSAWLAMLAQAPSISKAPSTRSVVHVSTHFKISTLQFDQSKLFLGDGSHYSLQELIGMYGDLSDIDLLTLSACNSVTDSKFEGKEFEGLGATFQRKGVKAVLGTLWAVEDESTASLMQQFYKHRGEQRKMSKAQALQEAQKAMLASEKWRHPYYWSGFVLMGNWL